MRGDCPPCNFLRGDSVRGDFFWGDFVWGGLCPGGNYVRTPKSIHSVTNSEVHIFVYLFAMVTEAHDPLSTALVFRKKNH